MIDKKQLLMQVKQIELVVDQYLSATMAGLRESDRRETGLANDSSEIDWLASTGTPNRTLMSEYLKEKQLTVMILADLSASMRFCNKKQLLLRVATVLGFSALFVGDKVGLITFSDQIETVRKPRASKDNLLRILLEDLWEEPQGNATNLQLPCKELQELNCDPGSMICYLSDFPISLLTDEFGETLNLLAYKHDLIPISLTSPWERSLESMKFVYLRVQDNETGEIKYLNTSRKNKFEKIFEKQKEKRKKFFDGRGLTHIDTYNMDYLDNLIQFFAMRLVKK